MVIPAIVLICHSSLFLSGDATVEKFKVRCAGWMDEGERTYRDPRFDKISVLTYAIVQSTNGSFIEVETIFVSGDYFLTSSLCV